MLSAKNDNVRVDFYLLPKPERAVCYSFACQLVYKAFQQKQSVYLHTSDQMESELLDNLLWTFHDISFIPHALWNPQEESVSLLILIGFNPDRAPLCDLLINFKQTVPNFFKQFKRIIEFVSQEDSAKTLSRRKYVFYRQAACSLHTHHLSSLTPLPAIPTRTIKPNQT